MLELKMHNKYTVKSPITLLANYSYIHLSPNIHTGFINKYSNAQEVQVQVFKKKILKYSNNQMHKFEKCTTSILQDVQLPCLPNIRLKAWRNRPTWQKNIQLGCFVRFSFIFLFVLLFPSAFHFFFPAIQIKCTT